MREPEARAQIAKSIAPTRQLVTLAKAMMLAAEFPAAFDFPVALKRFTDLQGYQPPQYVNLNPQRDPSQEIATVVGAISCEIALAQAAMELIGEGYMMYEGNLRTESPRQGWTTVIPGSGGQTGGWTFEEFKYTAPYRLFKSPYWLLNKPSGLFDPDLFVLEAGIKGAAEEVEEALRDAIACLKQGLFRPAVTMLGKAVEGAWIETGISLAGAARGSSGFDADEFTESMKAANPGIAAKMRRVTDLYERRDLLKAIHQASGVQPAEFRAAYTWSDTVREARNAIHFDTKPALANSYDKVVGLLLGAQKNLALLYSAKRAADSSK